MYCLHARTDVWVSVAVKPALLHVAHKFSITEMFEDILKDFTSVSFIHVLKSWVFKMFDPSYMFYLFVMIRKLSCDSLMCLSVG